MVSCWTAANVPAGLTLQNCTLPIQRGALSVSSVVCITQTDYVYCAVRTEYFSIIHVSLVLEAAHYHVDSML